LTLFQNLPKQSYKRLTWKNGLGFTDEIGIYPKDSELRLGNFLWRISTAQIEKSSPFSIFPDHDRILVLLEGGASGNVAGDRGNPAIMRLTHSLEGDESAMEEELGVLVPYEFPGDVPTRCELISGLVTDLSVFFRKGQIQAEVLVHPMSRGEFLVWQPRGGWNFAFAACGNFRVLAGGDSLFLENDPENDPNEEQTLESYCFTPAEDGAALISISLTEEPAHG